MPPLITFDEALALGGLSDRDEIADLVERAWAGPPRALRRLDRHVLAGQREVRRLRRGLRLLRAVALRRGRHADARDDGARPDPRARQGRRGRGRPPLLHGDPGPGAVEARLREDPRGRAPGLRADQPQALRLGRPHLPRPAPRSWPTPGSSASTTTSRPRAATTTRSRRRSATRAGCGRSTRSRTRASRRCVGGILNLGESPRQRVEMAFELAEINPTSVPINLLNPRTGTKFGDRELMDPWEVVKWVAIFRLDPPRRPVPALRRARREPRRPRAARRQGGAQRRDDGQLPDHARGRPRRGPGDVRGAGAQRRAPGRTTAPTRAPTTAPAGSRARRRRRRSTS